MRLVAWVFLILIGSTLPAWGDDPVTAERNPSAASNSPLLSFGKLLFVKRHTFQSSHYYTEYVDGCQYYGGNLCVLRIADGQVTELVPQWRGGIFGRFDLSFDGTYFGRRNWKYRGHPDFRPAPEHLGNDRSL